MDDTMSVCVYLLFKIAVLDSTDADKAELQHWVTKVSKHFSDKQKAELRKNGYCV